MEKEYVWYACYGSNINNCTDDTPPAEARTFIIPYSIYFAKYSALWGGAPCFIDDTKPGMAYEKIYKITKEQYEEVKEMEGPSYTKKLTFDDIDGLPVYSFTDSCINADEYLPSFSYLDTILKGLKETYRNIVAEEELEQYLNDIVEKKKEEIRNGISG